MTLYSSKRRLLIFQRSRGHLIVRARNIFKNISTGRIDANHPTIFYIVGTYISIRKTRISLFFFLCPLIRATEPPPCAFELPLRPFIIKSSPFVTWHTHPSTIIKTSLLEFCFCPPAMKNCNISSDSNLLSSQRF